MVTLLLRFAVATHRQTELLAFLARAKPYYEAPGGITVRLLQDVGDPRQLIEVVTYRDEETWRRDQQRVEADPRMHELLAEWRAFHLANATVETYREVVIPESG
jgi:hypothetical protein